MATSEDDIFTRPRPPRPTAAAPARQPQSATEAESRFWARYGERLLADVLGQPVSKPTTIEGWIAFAEVVRDLLDAHDRARVILNPPKS